MNNFFRLFARQACKIHNVAALARAHGESPLQFVGVQFFREAGIIRTQGQFSSEVAVIMRGMTAGKSPSRFDRGACLPPTAFSPSLPSNECCGRVRGFPRDKGHLIGTIIQPMLVAPAQGHPPLIRQ